MANDENAGVPPRPEKRRVVTQLARPFFFTPSGEKVELSVDALGGAAGTVDAAALDADAADDGASGDVRPLYVGGGMEVVVEFGDKPRVGRRPARTDPAPSAPGDAPAADTTGSADASAGVTAAAEPASSAAPAPPVPSAPVPSPGSVDPPAPIASVTADAPAAIPAPVVATPPASVPAPVAMSGPASAAANPPAPPSPPDPLPAAPPAATLPPARIPSPVSEIPSAPATASEGRWADEEDDDMGRADAARVEIRSEEIDEILSAMPGGLLRWGTTAVFLTLSVLLGISWFIAYPDVVKGRVALTTGTPPVRLVARQPGEVARVLTRDGERTAAGQPLVLLKNPAAYEDVQTLSGLLDRMEPMLRHDGPLVPVDAGRPLALGALQAPYSTLLQAHADYRLAHDEAFYAQRLGAARAQLADLEGMLAQLRAQQPLVEQQLAIAERNQARARELSERGLAAAVEVEQAEAAQLARRLEVENGRGAITNSQLQLNAQRAALVDLEQRRFDEGERGLVALRGAHAALRAALSAWEQENVLRAPVAGTVAYFRELRENQAVGAAEALVAVVPDGGGLVGRVTLSGMGAGKVEPGQRVIMRLDGFPYREYGTLSGTVARVSALGFQADARTPEVTYLAEVNLTKGLVTSYGRTLAFRQEMTGEVDVVTEEMRLIERVFNKLRTLRGTE
jgi:multidrug resistance efflux pump